MSNIVLVGNPRVASKTLRAAKVIAAELFGEEVDDVIDIAVFAPRLFESADRRVDAAVARVTGSTRLIVASPTYRGTYTGLLKLFLDRLPGGSLGGTIAFPLMLGAGQAHAMAPEMTLRPVLVELGASCPVRGLYLTEEEAAEGTLPLEWLRVARARAGLSRGIS